MVAGALVHGSGEGEANAAFGLRRWFRITPEETGGTFAVFEEEIPEGAGPPLHIHHDAQELFVVLEGAVLFECEGRRAEAGPGASVLIPQHAKHSFKGIGPGTSRALVTLTPGRGIGFFKAVEAEGLDPATDMDRIGELANEYALEFAGPPL